jgi:hypothetical protein
MMKLDEVSELDRFLMEGIKSSVLLFEEWKYEAGLSNLKKPYSSLEGPIQRVCDATGAAGSRGRPGLR